MVHYLIINIEILLMCVVLVWLLFILEVEDIYIFKECIEFINFNVVII